MHKKITIPTRGNLPILYSHSRTEPFEVALHLHDGYEIFFAVSGDIRYFVEKQIYPLKFGDLMLTNPHEIHQPTFLSDKPYERIFIQFKPSAIPSACMKNFNLLHCFINRKNGEQNKITLDARQIHFVMDLFHKFELLKETPEGAGVLKLSYLLELLVFINRIFMKLPTDETPNVNIPMKLVPILDYIDNHLDSDLHLETLEKMFFIDRFHLSKLFKKSIGSSIHNYIVYKRISRAKYLLSQGFNVTDACAGSGFNDYSNFIKMFKKTVGISPGKYRDQSRIP